MEIVDGAVGYLRSEGVAADGVHYLANCFTIADRIAEAANGWSADVIVLGSKRRRWFSRFGGAGLRERVTSISGLPVLTAPAPLRVAHDKAARELELIVPTAGRQQLGRQLTGVGVPAARSVLALPPAHPTRRSR